MVRILLACTIMVIPLFGCSSFDKEFKAAASRAATQPTSVEGAWTGTWKSHAGHGGGKLRCVLTRAEGDTYRARFEATFWGIFKGGYSIGLNGKSSGEGLNVDGEEDLGWLAGGKYQYVGTVTATEFHADYVSKHDKGVFEMKRALVE